MTDEEKPFSPALASALRAVARMRGDAMPDAALWAAFVAAVRGDVPATAAEERIRAAHGDGIK